MKLVPLDTLFDIQYGNKFDLYKLDRNANSNINFVSRSSQNLGVVCKVSKYNSIEPFPNGLITVTLGGTYLLSSFVQQQEFYTAQNIKVLTPKKEMSFVEKIFYCKAIELNRNKYTSHGREANKTLNALLVPEKVPNKFTQIKINEIDQTTERPILKKTSKLQPENWRSFKLSCLFNIKGSITNSLLELKKHGKGEYPFVTTQSTNNSVAGFFNTWTETGGVLVIDSAVLGYCSYQEKHFCASDHVEKLIPTFPMNKYVALFLVTILNMEQYRFNYGRKCSQERLKKMSIKLPARGSNPDFDFMEKYIKSLPYSVNL